jgi:hypothetical protein
MGAIPLLSAQGGGDSPPACGYGSNSDSKSAASNTVAATCQRILQLDGRGSAQSGDSCSPLLDAVRDRAERGSSSRSEGSGASEGFAVAAEGNKKLGIRSTKILESLLLVQFLLFFSLCN